MPRRRAGGKRLALQVQLSVAQDLFLEACAAVEVAEKKMNNLHAIQAEWLRKNAKWMDKDDRLADADPLMREDKVAKRMRELLRRQGVF